MTPGEIKSIQEIQGTVGFRIIEALVDKYIKELDSVSDIDGRSETRAGIQALAKNKAVKVLKDFKNEITLSGKPERETKRTYE